MESTDYADYTDKSIKTERPDIISKSLAGDKRLLSCLWTLSYLCNLRNLWILFQIFDWHRLDCLSQLKSKNSRVKIQFAIQRSFDIFGATKAVLLAFKRQIS